jgi:hypothetical protein
MSDVSTAQRDGLMKVEDLYPRGWKSLYMFSFALLCACSGAIGIPRKTQSLGKQ